MIKLKIALLAAVGVSCIEETAETVSDAGVDSGVDAGLSTACESPTPLVIRGQPTGLVTCADGSHERVSVQSCLPSSGTVPTCDRGEGCSTSEDCGGEPTDLCLAEAGVGGCYCHSACETDADCGPGAACLCAGPNEGRGFSYSRCVPAQCSTNTDCDSGSCGLSIEDTGCGLAYAFACRDAAVDTCRSADECPTDHLGQTCNFLSGSFNCSGPEAVCGRPLQVEGQSRTALSVDRADWLETHQPRLDGLSWAVRQRLAAFWTGIGALEHASVAGFARFSLQLMALGAPADLLIEAQTAALDEIRHAQLAYGLASAYSGKKVGPGPTQLDDFTLETDPDAIAAELAIEACVGETMGASEAAEAAAQCEDPVVRAIWQRIAEDEARHAALGWKTLAWLLHQGSESTHEAAKQAFGQARLKRLAGTGTDGLPELGMCASAARHATHQQTWQDVIAPCIAALGLA